MILSTVGERTTAYLTVEFKDKDGNLVSPTGITYRIDCVTNGEEILDDTPFTPLGSSIEITITPDQNAIIDQQNPQETKRVTVKATYGASDEVNDQFDYIVKNLTGV